MSLFSLVNSAVNIAAFAAERRTRKISMDSAGRPTAATPQPGAATRRSAPNVGNVMLTAELTRLNTDLGYFLF